MKDETVIPAWGGNYAPLRLIARPGDKWGITLDEANSRSYESAKLFRSSLSLDVGIAPFSMIVLFDGTLVVPRNEHISKGRALAIFNKHLTDLLLGGLFCSEVLPDDVTPGGLNVWGYHRHFMPRGRYAKLSQSLRTCRADPDEVIHLVDIEPLTTTSYMEFHKRGMSVSRCLPGGFSTVFLPACTGFCNEEWERSLILGWSAVELLISQIWEQEIVTKSEVVGVGNKRRKTFLRDSRTWTAATKIEVLWQRDMIDDDLYGLLDRGRSARNTFIHSAEPCSPESAKDVLIGALRLIETIASFKSESFEPLKIMACLEKHTSAFRPSMQDAEPKYWRYADPAPGFSDWKDRPFEKIPELQLIPVRRGEVEGEPSLIGNPQNRNQSD